jgi:hypothetical protein
LRYVGRVLRRVHVRQRTRRFQQCDLVAELLVETVLEQHDLAREQPRDLYLLQPLGILQFVLAQP